MAAGIQAKVRAGLGVLLDAAGAVTWQASGAVDAASDPPPLFDMGLPDAPDVAAALATYYLGGDEPTLSASVVNLQVRTRSSRTDSSLGDDLDDAIAQQLLGNFPVVLTNGVTISVITRQSGTPIGRDADGRWERVTNYRLIVHDPGPHRG